ncbi:hypothetical protein Holit_02970 [Hollandina sp. SP2]
MTSRVLKSRITDFWWYPVNRVNSSNKADFIFSRYFDIGLYIPSLPPVFFHGYPLEKPSVQRLYGNLDTTFNVSHGLFSVRFSMRSRIPLIL